MSNLAMRIAPNLWPRSLDMSPRIIWISKLMENGLKIEGQSGYRETKSSPRAEARSTKKIPKYQAKAPAAEGERSTGSRQRY
ncbi:MAG: hypothetical protein EBY73_01320 [Burkholderiaceae bacterium]|nr:hypothetical protein [Burkholderiaceae bacterium]